jgi:hypothetical protein
VALTAQSGSPDAGGAALFACQALGLRDVLPIRTSFSNRFVVGAAPYLRPLATMLAEKPVALVVFAHTESARLIPLTLDAAVEEVVLDSDVATRHHAADWIQMAQTQYQRYIQNHRARHFEAVVDTLAALVERDGIQRLVLAGETRTWLSSARCSRRDF